MILLALDTATECCSVALAIDGAIHSRSELAPRRHAELLLPWIDAMLAEHSVQRAQIDAVAVGRGPGGFTGVRLAVAAAQGIAYGLDRPLLAVSSLAALAMQAGAAKGERVLAAIDARMGELYLGAFRIDAEGLAVAEGEEWMAAPQQVALEGEGWIGVGSGFCAADGALAMQLGSRLARFDAQRFPQAEAIARLGLRQYAAGAITTAHSIEPAYLRDKVAKTLAERGVSR
jgi:tRNA threonylcarbamoyladenosine biosynthesis protein TsaB